SETPVSITTSEDETPYVIRKEHGEWLAFNTRSCTVSNLGRVSLSDINLPGEIVRDINNDEVEGAMSAPLKLFLSVSDRFSLSCEHCMSSPAPSGEKSLDNQNVMDIADEAAEAGVFQITTGGREPLIYKGIFRVIEH